MSAIESIDTVYRNNRNLQDVMGIPYDMEWDCECAIGNLLSGMR